MILVIANVLIKNGSNEEFISFAKKCINDTRKEDGNISYKLLNHIENTCSFSFLEEWRSKDDLDFHMTTDHFIEFGKNIESLLSEPFNVHIYDSTKL